MFCVAIPVDWLVRELRVKHNRHTYKPGHLFGILIKSFFECFYVITIQAF